ncbi:GntR family transcriptional regulator [Streptomyces sp. NPDC047117]|uniref:GntR family transcriptional regulator n=1 Tax=Streptomyces sp. NPDC047117 TaxID=3155379 RepID=UPI0033F089D3
MVGTSTPEPPHSVVPVARVPLSEQVRRHLLQQLLDGRWEPGDRIIERRVAQELGVSQAPVREALRDLQAMQLIESTPGKGVRVRELTPDQLSEVYPVRAALERLAAELAVPRLAGDVSTLEPHLERMHQAAREGNTDAQITHGVEFHREIVRAAGNHVLFRNWESLAIELWTRLSLKWLRTGLHENAADHEAIVQAFRRQDPYAGRLVQLHVLDYANKPIGAP